MLITIVNMLKIRKLDLTSYKCASYIYLQFRHKKQNLVNSKKCSTFALAFDKNDTNNSTTMGSVSDHFG